MTFEENIADKILTVLPGGRGLKGIAEDYDRNAAAGCKLSVQSSHRAGTKRRRVIKSGADELLDLERAEDDKDDEGDLADSTHHRHGFDFKALEQKSKVQRWCIFPRRLPGNGHRHPSQVTLPNPAYVVLRRASAAALVLPKIGACMLRGYG